MSRSQPAARPAGRSGRWTLALLLAVLLMGSMALAVGAGQRSPGVPVVPPWRAEPPWTSERALVTVDGVEVMAEIADTPAMRSRGLGFRDGLAPGTGMLFLFEDEQVRSFWMYGMRFCIDIIWITDGAIVGAERSVCPLPGVDPSALPRYTSPVPVGIVLEVPAGWLDQHGIADGATVEILLPAG